MEGTMRTKRKGQVAIIVLLISAMMLTLGLSLSKSATVETKIDINDELLNKAFNAAESGINYYLGTGGTKYNSPDGVSSADLSVKDIVGEGEVLDFSEFTPKNETQYYWLVNHDVNGNIGNVYYNETSLQVCGVGFTGSLEINYFYLSGGNYGVHRYGYNFNSATSRVNGFVDVSGDCVTVATDRTPLLLAITPYIYGGKFYLKAASGGVFPSQGVEITSTGKAGGVSTSVTGQASKQLSVEKRYEVPAFMLSGIVSEDSLLSD